MGNKGYITVFLSILMASILLIGLTAIEIVGINMDKARVYEASNGAVENLKAGYNAELFKDYHLLLLDKNCMGKGQGALEEITKNYLEYTFQGSNLVVSDVAFTELQGVMDNDCEELKQQIAQYMDIYEQKELLLDIAGIVSQENTAENVRDKVSNGKNEDEDKEVESNWKGTDPRKTLKKLMKNGLLNLVLPEGVELSEENIDTDNLPSKNKTSDIKDTEIDFKFKNINKLEKELGDSDYENMSDIQENYYGIMYTLECFDYLLNENDMGHSQKCEVEYIICGKKNDYENVSSIVNRILLHRLPVNMACIMADRGKMSQVESISAVLAFIPGVTYGAVKYLILATWSYAETIVEIKALLQGKSIQLIKTGDNWMTDINKLNKIMNIDAEDYQGKDKIDYKGFLMLFLLENNKNMYYRICDMIELNMKEYYADFRISDCISSFSLDIGINGRGMFSGFLNTYSGDKNLYNYSLSVYGAY
jgi:hypothetical protein